jgi:hypothetical protein
MTVNEKICNIIAEELDKKDLLSYIKKDKDFEKRVKEIVSDVVVDMYRVLWQHNNIFKTLGR